LKEQEMGLRSKLFSGDPTLEACLIHNPAHIKEGAVGKHVSKIQTALLITDGFSVSPDELRTLRYGPSTSYAVLSFKRKRNIINYSYESQVDNIVGKMTIAALDNEVRLKEMGPYRQPDKSTYGMRVS
jgi:hypothetical protein